MTPKYLSYINHEHQALVLEMGMRDKGDLAKHCQHIRPDYAIITMVGSSHLSYFGGSIALLAGAKSEIIEHMNPKGTLFLNADDPNSKMLKTKDFQGKIVRVGITSQTANYVAFDIRYRGAGMTFKVLIKGKVKSFYIPIPGRHNVYNALFAIAVARELGFGINTIKAGLHQFHNHGRRVKVYRLKNHCRLIDDSYNASPHSVVAAIDVLTHIGTKRNILILGGMHELGEYSEKGHSAVGKHIAESKVDYLLTYGSTGKTIRNAAIAAGFPAKKSFHADYRKALHSRLKSLMIPGTTVLVKGSNATMMFLTAKYIRNTFGTNQKDPDKARS